jgi:hypothetical protein
VLGILGIILLSLLGMILLLGFLPISSESLEFSPNPASTYDEAVARYKQLEHAEQGIVNDVSGSYLLSHEQKTPRVYMLIHGTTNSSFQ